MKKCLCSWSNRKSFVHSYLHYLTHHIQIIITLEKHWLLQFIFMSIKRAGQCKVTVWWENMREWKGDVIASGAWIDESSLSLPLSVLRPALAHTVWTAEMIRKRKDLTGQHCPLATAQWKCFTSRHSWDSGKHRKKKKQYIHILKVRVIWGVEERIVKRQRLEACVSLWAKLGRNRLAGRTLVVGK